MVRAREQGRACQLDGQIPCVVERVRERGNGTSIQGGADITLWRPGRAEVAILGNVLLVHMLSRTKGLETEQTQSYGGVHAGVSTGVELRYALHPRWLVTSRAVVGQTTSFLLSSEGPPNDTFDRGIAHRQWRVGLSYVR
ncbi:MAG TPA: hypothetical protein VGE27_00390 [Gemmatimonas sp.]|uniref:hypothetical protein n=1 Tax=Gemmatimonas sp. TaxID=1962908 RepID=UPI002ED7C294